MIVTNGIENIRTVANTAATLGSYDGVHLGHREIIKHLISIGIQRQSARTVLITFDPHPQEILRKNNTDIRLLTTLDERIELLSETGIDEMIILRFSEEFSRMPYHEFFRKVLINTIGVSAMVVGFNHAFGRNREGDIAHLRTLAAEHSIFVDETPAFMIDGDSISSTKIRHYLQTGDIESANRYLGRQYSLDGIVVKGNGLGKEFGFPTANIRTPQNKLIPADGIYAGSAMIGDTTYSAAISIGTRPTITESTERVVEAFLLDFNGNLYNKRLRVSLQKYMRPQAKFSSHSELIDAMQVDIQNIRSVFS